MTPQNLIQTAYNKTIRLFLPKKVAVFNGVAYPGVKLLDNQVCFPDYEGALIAGIRQHATPGDDIIIIGGGRGISTVAAARTVEPSGSVTVFEGSRDYLNVIHDTLDLNDITDGVTIRNAIVGEDRGVWGDTAGVDIVPPRDLPDCDVLVMDCEGAEQIILPELPITPKTLIVESHGHLDSPTDDVREKVENLGYEVGCVKPEVAKKDVFVITAHR